jgi:hypothetical protein
MHIELIVINLTILSGKIGTTSSEKVGVGSGHRHYGVSSVTKLTSMSVDITARSSTGAGTGSGPFYRDGGLRERASNVGK